MSPERRVGASGRQMRQTLADAALASARFAATNETRRHWALLVVGVEPVTRCLDGDREAVGPAQRHDSEVAVVAALRARPDAKESLLDAYPAGLLDAYPAGEMVRYAARQVSG
jgi:hypothetical protein